MKKRERKRGGGKSGRKRNDETPRSFVFVFVCARSKGAYMPVNLIKARYLASRARLAQVSARLFRQSNVTCVARLCSREPRRCVRHHEGKK